MTKEQRKEINSLLESSNYLKAYEKASLCFKNNPKDYEALILRVSIDIDFSLDYKEDTVNDLDILINCRNSLRYDGLELAILYYSTYSYYDEVIMFFYELKKKYKNYPLGGKHNIHYMYYTLSLAFLYSKNYFNPTLALEYSNKALELLDGNDDIEYYFVKANALLLLEKADEALSMMVFIQNTFGPSDRLYMLKIRYYLLIGIPNEIKQKNDLSQVITDAFNNITYFENYSGDHMYAMLNRLYVYEVSGNFEKVLEIAKECLASETCYKDNILQKLVSAYINLGLIEEGINYFLELLDKDFSIDTYFCLLKLYRFFLTKCHYDDYETKKNAFDNMIKYILPLYKENQEEYINVMCIIYSLVDLHQEFYQILLEYKENHGVNGLVALYLATEASTVNESYSTIKEYYDLAYEYGQITYEAYHDRIDCILENPSKNYKFMKKIAKRKLDELSDETLHAIGTRYLYGSHGFKQNVLLAKEYFNKASVEYFKCSYNIVIKGVIEEMLGNINEAFKYYSIAKSRQSKDKFYFSCKHLGFLSHCYYNGIGTLVDKNLAYKLILDAIDYEGIYSSSIVCYLYTYYALKEVEGFSKDYAYLLLSNNDSFARYELTRVIYLNKLRSILFKDDNKEELSISVCLKYCSEYERDYYVLHKTEDIMYPIFIIS